MKDYKKLFTELDPYEICHVLVHHPDQISKNRFVYYRIIDVCVFNDVLQVKANRSSFMSVYDINFYSDNNIQLYTTSKFVFNSDEIEDCYGFFEKIVSISTSMDILVEQGIAYELYG